MVADTSEAKVYRMATVRQVLESQRGGIVVDKVWFVLLVTSPFLAAYAWAIWWFITDAFRERKRMLAAVAECEGHRGAAGSMDKAA